MLTSVIRWTSWTLFSHNEAHFYYIFFAWESCSLLHRGPRMMRTMLQRLNTNGSDEDQWWITFLWLKVCGVSMDEISQRQCGGDQVVDHSWVSWKSWWTCVWANTGWEEHFSLSLDNQTSACWKKVHKYYIFLDDSSWNYRKMLHECTQKSRMNELESRRQSYSKRQQQDDGITLRVFHCAIGYMCQADLSSWYQLKAPDDDRQLLVGVEKIIDS